MEIFYFFISLRLSKDLQEGEEKERDAQIFELYIQCYLQEEIAEKLHTAQKTISNNLSKLSKDFKNSPT